tara:strand:- start:8538 stop:9659 length:1122 start_codon:yes stop_codon:yes gene_type:complete
MIDTVILKIPMEQIRTLEGSKKWDLYSSSGSFQKYIKNENKDQKLDGVYRPRVAVIIRGRQKLLKIEFSAPKLIFGNNVDEVSEKDADEIYRTLQKRLVDFGVIADLSILRRASVSACHFSKNFVLKDGYTAQGIIKELQKINLNKRMDLTRDRFMNDGESLHYYANNHSFVLYDKIRDLNKPKKRAIDKDQTIQQLSLFRELDKRKNTEILRMEIRLSFKRKLGDTLENLGYDRELIFDDVFNPKLAKDVIQSYWQKLVTDKNIFLFGLESNSQKILADISQAHTNLTAYKSIYLVGLSVLSKEESGLKGLRKVVENISSKRTWYRISADLKLLNGIHTDKNCHTWVNQINKEIEEFRSIKLSTLNVKNCKV